MPRRLPMPPALPSANNLNWRWRFFWNWLRTSPAMPCVQSHGNPRNLTHYFNFIWVCIRFNVTIRSRMGLHNQLSVAHGTPPADVAFTVFQEVNGTVEFTGPPRRSNLPLSIINYHQRSRRNQREHRPVFGPDVSIAIIP